MKMQIKRIIKSLFSIAFAIFFAVSCEIGLGQEVDQSAPVISVSSPAILASVPQSFEVKGTAKDNYGITKITVEISETSQQYQYNGSEWQVLVNDSWKTYDKGKISGSASDLTWSVIVNVTQAKSAQDYTIVSRVYDEMGNEGKSSKDERCITIDIVEPSVSIIEPVLTSTYSVANSNKNTYTTKDNNVLSYLLNGDFVISGSQKEDTSLDSLYVYLDEGTSESITEYNNETDITKLIDPILTRKITGESLRNWETTVKLSELPGTYISGKHLIRLITESHDKAGNVERKVQGWFIYYNEADIPWIDARFGDETDIPNEDSEAGPVQTQVFPNCSLQGQVYDDDGIAEVKIVRTVYDKFSSTWLEDSAFTINADMAKEKYPKYYAWSINAISENKRFKIEVTCKDINGNEGEKIVRYMGITDTTPPSITIESPLNGSTVISENITIKGKVVDDGGITSLKMVRLQNKNKEKLMDYFSGDDGWITEKDGNKIFLITLSGSDIPVGGYVTKNFSRTFNIFTDFGISEEEVLNTQTFVFKAVDNNNSSSVEAFTLQGDTEAPKLTIEKVEVVPAVGSSVEYDISSDEIKTLNPFNKQDGLITDKITLSGKWNDNSYNEWKKSDKIGKIKVKIYGEDYDVTPTGSGSGDKEWKIENISPKDNSTVSITASLTDFGGNTTKSSSCFYVNSSNPELVSISSITPNGSYKNDDLIKIVLEYNKKVTFSGTTGAILNLNNGGKAYYDVESNSNGSAKHQYVYKVLSTDRNVAMLTVESIDKNGAAAEWKDTDNAKVLAVDRKPNNMNLGDLRSITIDKVNPKISSVSTSTASATYKAGNEIFTQLEFSEDVYFYDASGNSVLDNVVNSKLKLNYNIEGTYGSATTKLSAKNVVFKYVVAATANQDELKITSIDFGGLVVKDKAGNILDQNNILSSLYTDVLNGIKIDTTIPSTPSITLKEVADERILSDGNVVYSSSGAVITVDWGTNSGTVKKYSIDNGASWTNWPNSNSVTLNRNGIYHITAKQENAAGTESSHPTAIKVTLDSGKVLTSVTSSVSDGTYKAGKEIDIKMNFRKKVIIDTSYEVKLNIKNGTGYCTATYQSSKSSDTCAVYKYTITAGDKIEDSDGLLKVIEFNPSFITDEFENDIKAYCNLPSSGSRLQDSKSIKINTTIPTVQSVEFKERTSGTTKIPYLEIKFDMEINRGTGNITITQDETSFIPPAVLSSSEYAKYREEGNAIDKYYSEGTNGVDYESNKFTVDLTKKYVLNYDITPSNYASGSQEVKDIIDVLKEKNALKKTISIKSNSVNITGDSITIDLINQNKLPVKGVSYSIEIPDGLVLNILGVPNSCGITGESKLLYTKTYKGAEKPVIRVKKTAEYWEDTVLNTEPNQPLTAKVKIDCQSPNVNIYFVKSEKTSSIKAVNRTILPENGSATKLQKDTTSEHTSSPTLTITNANKYSTEFEIGSSTDKTKGYKVCIHAQAVDKTDNSIKSDSSYELANRTVIVFYDHKTLDDLTYRWIRGGDWTSGGVGTPNFPFSWNKNEYSKIRAMTSLGDTIEVTAPDSGNNNTKYIKNGFYWVSWNISTTAYVGFLAGDMPATADKAGPDNWCWTSNAWVALKEYYPIYPGESTRFDSVFENDNFSTCLGSSRGIMDYQDKHKESK